MLGEAGLSEVIAPGALTCSHPPTVAGSQSDPRHLHLCFTHPTATPPQLAAAAAAQAGGGGGLHGGNAAVTAGVAGGSVTSAGHHRTSGGSSLDLSHLPPGIDRCVGWVHLFPLSHGLGTCRGGLHGILGCVTPTARG